MWAKDAAATMNPRGARFTHKAPQVKDLRDFVCERLNSDDLRVLSAWRTIPLGDVEPGAFIG